MSDKISAKRFITLKKFPGWTVVRGAADENGLCYSTIYYNGLDIAVSDYPMTVEEVFANAESFIRKNQAESFIRNRAEYERN